MTHIDHPYRHPIDALLPAYKYALPFVHRRALRRIFTYFANLDTRSQGVNRGSIGGLYAGHRGVGTLSTLMNDPNDPNNTNDPNKPNNPTIPNDLDNPYRSKREREAEGEATLPGN